MNDLHKLRGDIDTIDLRLLHLLNARAVIVQEIQRVKQEMGLPPYSADREREIIDRLVRANEGPLPDDAVKGIFGSILHHMLSSLVCRPPH